MPGPLSTGKARRGNAPAWTYSAGGGDAPDWPLSRKATTAQGKRWAALWASEAASQWVLADAPAIARIVLLQLECERPDGRLGAFAALVTLEDRFGLSAAARRRLYVEAIPPEVGEPGQDEDQEERNAAAPVTLSVVSA